VRNQFPDGFTALRGAGAGEYPLPLAWPGDKKISMLDKELMGKCADRFAKESGLLAVWMLGSAVSGRLREGSDVDFAVYYEPGKDLDRAAHGALVGDLEAILGRPVDLGRLSTRNLIYAHQATQGGVLIHAADPGTARSFANRVQSLYLEFKEDRKEVEEAYRAR
jgi:predicted nucleotidyltransferase